ncbi:MAG: molecular chaperone HtpG [Lentisphaerae bacterium]|jgi:molecular chaperone HtpG|nr:molecular chaperone HtpG [Lentisphaerota bacterium]
MNMKTKKYAFKAEVSEMLDLVVHSLYSKKEIFLRELISNASDAIERAQYLGLTDKTIIADSPAWEINIVADKASRKLQISDNGIGMTAEEAESNLGMIARSGTQAFLDSLKSGGGTSAPDMIGQFGVGFYAAFMVASTVTVDTLRRGADQTAVRWQSDGKDGYTIGASDRATPGTTITLDIMPEHEHLIEEWQIKSLVKRYSDFIAYPIRLAVDGKEIDPDSEPLNTMRALWRRDKSGIKPEEYAEFYKHLTHDFSDPLRTIHYAAEGQLEFRALLFLPQKPTFDLFMPDRKHGLQLYVRNVFIGSDFEELLPPYLRFVKGVVDSSDLPLNVSREMLQDDVIISKIRKNLVGRILSELEALKRDDLKAYTDFFRGFGRVLKEGLHFDYENGDKLKELMLFASDRTADDGLISLRQYRNAMPSTQQEIYYLKAETLANARGNPHVEAFRKRELDVLFFVDPIDEWIIDALGEYDGCKFRAIDQGEIELGTEEEKSQAKEKLKDDEQQFRPLLDFIHARLTDDIKEVRLSNRLTDSASCLVADEAAMNPSMRRMMQAMGQEVPKTRRVLELNPSHPLLKRLLERFETERDSEEFAKQAELLYDLALVAEGSQPRDPHAFTLTLASRLAE